MVRFLVGLAALATVALADITFSVIGYPSQTGNTFGVSINGAISKLVANETTYPVWTGSVPGTTSSVQYSYVELNSAGAAVKTESFVRKLNQTTDTHTDNEFFERPVTRHNIVRLPYTYMVTWPSKTKVFKEDQIATLHLTGTAALIDAMNQAPETEGTNVRVTVRFINADTIYTQNNISLKTAGKSSKSFAKQAYKLNFDTDYNQTFFSRPNIKLRSMATEPTMIREKLYIDMLNSVGVPTQQGSFVRLFINDLPYGLYLMVDDIKRSFIKQTVYGGDATKIPGSLIQSNAPTREEQADLVWKGATDANYNKDCYISQNLGNNVATAPLGQLIQFMADLQAFDPATTPNHLDYWNSRLDLDGFLRNMALEYLMGAFDNYWIGGSNYFIYFNPALSAAGKWQWIPTDFDGTFGNGAQIDPAGSYKNVSNFVPDHPLVSKLIIKSPEINAKFVDILKAIVSTAFKPEAMDPHMDSLHNMIALDAQWDYSLTRHSPGTDNKYEYQADFVGNMVNITKNMSGALKPWVASRATAIAAELGFTIPTGTADLVAPTPRPGKDGDGEDNGGKNGKGGHNGAGSLVATGLTAVVTLVSALVLLA
ncbi:coth protein-domain-containing protein [Mortierella sp. GBAus27b]|nr:hypothetical protein BGX31_008939 [Mortierella sp. GBA43]KAI8358363.1 coth protein-domain-containing protein [Mortierella sp. GBAus27b]